MCLILYIGNMRDGNLGKILSETISVTICTSSLLLSAVGHKEHSYFSSCCTRSGFSLRKSIMSPRHVLDLMIRESEKKGTWIIYK